ncbi:MAG: bifunctional 3,4-dihydroxy-2-butanone-4-phosphate synthase/GTP cyclohydrolase II [Proteobacteria bacterium]|nr:MAG: bifunctional 3,4-dihydroxy-2-butanone-4-phosphate synthase/GTP cyclohydrolase II [Pseudomonadota bacterium]
MKLSPFSEVLEDFRAGKMVVMVDHHERENEGDLIIATEKVSAQDINFMMREGRGLICVSISAELAEALNLPLQTLSNNSAYQTPFAVSIDHREAAGRGVTAEGRAFTMRRMLQSGASASEFVSPGYVFPLIASPLGVLGRKGQTEGSYDLARLAGFKSSGVLCEILNPDGSMARGRELQSFADRNELKITSVDEVARYRVKNEIFVREVAAANLETDFGLFQTRVFADDADSKEHLVLQYGTMERLKNEGAPLVRIHSECLTGDVFGSRRCDCGAQLSQAAELIIREGCGLIFYLRQEGRGIGLTNKLKAYALQDAGDDTVEANIRIGFEADQRDFAVAGKILHTLGVNRVRLITNNPAKVNTLESLGITVEGRVPAVVPADQLNRAYLETKREKLGHILP